MNRPTGYHVQKARAEVTKFKEARVGRTGALYRLLSMKLEVAQERAAHLNALAQATEEQVKAHEACHKCAPILDTSNPCDDCDGSGVYKIDDEPVRCICSEDQS